LTFLSILQIVALIIAVIFHEYSHGRIAEVLGDPTARRMGRLKVNPLVHIDPFGSVILPLLLIASGSPIVFGWAKPVPINPSYFRDARQGMLYVGVAGPASNLLMASGAGVLYRVGLFQSLPFLEAFVLQLVVINIVLAVFNLIPIPPLDGSRVAAALIPPRMRASYATLERYGILILFLLLFFFNRLFWAVIGPIIRLLATVIVGRGFF
jgi:Zn-dependent protease